jgi:hypothetical protein
VTTRDGQPRAYRLSIPEAGGGRTRTALAAEVVHLRIGSDALAPWIGTAPLRRASLTAAMLNAVESALAETFENAPLGSLIVPLPDTGADDMATMRGAFRGRRGSTLVIEGVAQATAAGMNPQIGQKPDQLSPDLSRSMTAETLAAAREGILMAYRVLPSLMNREQGSDRPGHQGSATPARFVDLAADCRSPGRGSDLEARSGGGGRHDAPVASLRRRRPRQGAFSDHQDNS